MKCLVLTPGLITDTQCLPGEIKDGVAGEFEGAAVTVNFFLHEQFESEYDEVTRAFRLETQIVETDKYDVHMVSYLPIQLLVVVSY